MNLILNYSEIERMILAKSGKKITLSYVDEKTIQCTYTIPLPFGFCKDIHVNAQIVSIDNDIVTVVIADKMVVNMLAEQITKHIDTDKFGIKIENGEFKIDLTKIEGAGKILEHAALSDITAEENGINIEALLNI